MAQTLSTDGPVRVTYDELPEDCLMRRAAIGAGFVRSVAAPVRTAGRTWGAVLASTRHPSGLPAGSELQLGAFTELLAVAISNAEAHATLVSQATTDPLTGLANRRVFSQRLSDELSRASRSGVPLSLVVLDIDRFKRVNDHHGHQTGDSVLQKVAEVLAAAARQYDLVARIGGEEFAWVLPDTAHDEAHSAAERMRETLGTTSIPPVGIVTCSAGIATSTLDSTPDRLLHAADSALYVAKSTGRNRVCTAVGGQGH